MAATVPVEATGRCGVYCFHFSSSTCPWGRRKSSSSSNQMLATAIQKSHVIYAVRANKIATTYTRHKLCIQLCLRVTYLRVLLSLLLFHCGLRFFQCSSCCCRCINDSAYQSASKQAYGCSSFNAVFYSRRLSPTYLYLKQQQQQLL